MRIGSGKRGFGGAYRDGGARARHQRGQCRRCHGDLAGGAVRVVFEGAAQRGVMAVSTKEQQKVAVCGVGARPTQVLPLEEWKEASTREGQRFPNW